jgi:hypothetical protein
MAAANEIWCGACGARAERKTDTRGREILPAGWRYQANVHGASHRACSDKCARDIAWKSDAQMAQPKAIAGEVVPPAMIPVPPKTLWI